jgi:hypothetical protein
MSRRNSYLDPDIKKKPQRQRSVLDRKDRTTTNLQKKISALKRYDQDDDGFDDHDADADASAGAGKAFGGREEKVVRRVNT